MTVSGHPLKIVERNEVVLAERLRVAIGRRTGEFPEGAGGDTELTALGVDSLLLLRIIADLVADPGLEIDVVELGDLVTVADLERFLVALTSRS
ncbi:acyl carrier protein [Micromonospora peucetia]|uniref:acyl carrier protein n=1 Tax=Micromonospora TaxID=1873 RepID=UPI00331A2BA9